MFFSENSLVDQWLSLCLSSAGGMGSIPGWGTKILHGSGCSQKTKSNTYSFPLWFITGY